VIACEDTRVTRRLLASLGLSTAVERFDAHVERAAVERWATRVAEGERVALVSDAGTPAVSDPGQRLVAACRARGLEVVPVPGPSALVAAVSASGLPAEPLLHLGFIARSGRARAEALDLIERTPATAVLFESGPRLPGTLGELAGRWPDREAVVARELTKRFESWTTGTLAHLAALHAAPPKGELVLLLAPPRPDATEATPADIDRRIAEVFGEPEPGAAKAVAARIAGELGVSKRDVYDRISRMKAEGLIPR